VILLEVRGLRWADDILRSVLCEAGRQASQRAGGRRLKRIGHCCDMRERFVPSSPVSLG
jgi:hypothetical protein